MRRIVVELDDSMHKELKISALKQEKTIKKYVTDMLEKEILKNGQDNGHLGNMQG